MRLGFWLGLLLAAWSIASPWALGFSDLNLAFWNNILIGALIFVFALSILGSRRP